MGLLSFTKKSRKQEKNNQSLSNQAFSLTPHLPSQENNYNTSLFPLHASRNFDMIDTSVPKQPETSLMDDIMNELDSVKPIKKNLTTYQNPTIVTKPNNNSNKKESQSKAPGPLLSFDSPPSTAPSSANNDLVGGVSINPAYVASEQQQKFASRNMQQQRLKPLISFSNNNETSMQRDMIVPHIDDTDSYFSDTDNEPILAASAMRQSTGKMSPAELLNTSVINNGRKSVTPPPTTVSSVNLMDRMKERHRLEVRRSLNNSPFMDNQTSPRKNLSSPSMPLIFSNEESTSQNNNGVLAAASARPAVKPLVQSQSFSVKPPAAKRTSGFLVRSASTAEDIYGGASNNFGPMPIQFQCDNNLGKCTSPIGTRNSIPPTTNRTRYLQTGAILSNISIHEELSSSEDNSIPARSPLNRSMSAYSTFPPQTLMQQQFQQQQQQINIQQKIQQQQQQQQLQNQIQQQIEHQQLQQRLEQQRIQQQLDQKQLQLQEQQRLQQYQLQQLKLQQQHQLYINQVISETPIKVIKQDIPSKAIQLDKEKPVKKSPLPLYERSSSPTKPDSNQILSPDTPPPESNLLQSPLSTTNEDDPVEEILLSNSSTSTLTDTPLPTSPPTPPQHSIKDKVIKLPTKLKRELQSMQLRRSPYSVPDLTTFSNTEQEEEQDNLINWSTIQLFSTGQTEIKQELSPPIEPQYMFDTKLDCYSPSVMPIIIKCCSSGCSRSKRTCSKKHHQHRSTQSCSHIRNSDSNYSIDTGHRCHHKKHHHSSKHSSHHRHSCHKRDSYSRYAITEDTEF